VRFVFRFLRLTAGRDHSQHGGDVTMGTGALDAEAVARRQVAVVPLEARRACLFEIAPQLRPSIGYSERFDAPLPDVIKMVRQHRLEGIVAKRVGSPYRSGERSGDWLKWRANRGQEFVIGGYIANDSGVDSLLVGYYEDRDLMYAGRVRAGLAAASRHLLLPHLEELQIGRCPFSNLPERSEGHWGDGLTAGKWICAAGSILS
jgi:ATP-dependent DNA ligase